MFKRKISKWEAEQALRDAEMRRNLLETLQEGTKSGKPGVPVRPEPMRDDDGVISELKRILRIR